MSLRSHRVLRKRDSYLQPSGSVVESEPTPTGSLLVQNTMSVTGIPLPSSGIPLTSSSVFETLSTPAVQSPTPTSAASSSNTSGDQISLGTVIGACVAALIALLLSVLLAFYCSKRHKKSTAYARSRNAVNNISRRRSRLEPWKRIDDGGDHGEGQAHSMKQRPLSGPLGAMFHRTISNTSGEKSSEAGNRESVGTMQHFAKYHPGLAAEMASQGAGTGVDEEVAKPAPVLRLKGRASEMVPPVSWDGETVGGDSFFSLHSTSVSPNMMATERSTPPATTTVLHRWESAEVVHVSQVGSEVSDTGELQNPFSDKASSVKSRNSMRVQNPFFSGRDHLVRRTLLPDTHENPFADTNVPQDSSDAIRSLIAALEVPKEQDNNRVISVQSSVYSRATGDDGDSAISVAAFPYPPTQINLR